MGDFSLEGFPPQPNGITFMPSLTHKLLSGYKASMIQENLAN